MRILIVTASLPYPLASGGAIRTYGIIHGLSRAGHQITLMSFQETTLNPASTPLAELCEEIITLPAPNRSKFQRLRDLLLTRQPDIAGRFYGTNFANRLLQLLIAYEFDLVQFEGIESVVYMPLVKQVQPRAKVCFDTFNAEYALQRNIFDVDRRDIRRWPMALYSYLQIGRITRFERQMCQMADCVIAVSQEDADLLRGFREDERIYVVSSGVFFDDYAKEPASIDLPPNALVFTGKMDYRPNVDAALWFTQAIFPLVRRQIPEARLYIVGQKPHRRLDVLRTIPDVHLTGWVESAQPYLHAAGVYIAPLRMGSGTRLKLLEAMASGCAIVATTIASAGLQAKVKQAMIIEDSEGQFASAVIALLKNPERRQQLGESARHFVKQHYDWHAIIPQLLNAYKEIGLG